MADVQEVIKRLIVEAQTRGLDKAAADFEKFGTTAKQAAASAENSLASTGKSFERLAGSIDPARKQLQMLAKDLAVLESGRGRAGVSDEYINGLKEARIASANLAIEAAKTNAAIGAQANGFAKMGPAVGLARHEMVNFGRQVQDIGVSLASGQSPLMVLVQQGTQVADIFATSQTSVKGFAAQIGSAAARFGPWVAAIAAVGTALYAVNRAMDQALEAQQALGGGRGRFLGATPADVAGAAGRAAGGGVSTGEAREGIIGGIRAGAPSLDVLERGQRLAQQYAATTGGELKKAQEDINQILGDRTTKSFEAAAKSLGTYDAATVKLVRELQSQGKFADAAQVALTNLSQGLVTNAQAAGAAAKAWADFKSWLDNTANAAAKVITQQETLAEKAARLRDELAKEPQVSAGFMRRGFTTDPVRERKAAELRDLEQQLQDAEDRRARMQGMADVSDRSRAGKEAVQAIHSESEALEKLKQQHTDITAALEDQARGRTEAFDTRTLQDYGAALESIAVKMEAMKGGKFAGQFGEGPVGDRMARREEDYQAKIGSIGAVGSGAREAAAVEEALIQARRNGAGEAERLQIAEQTIGTMRAQEAAAIAESTRAHEAQIQSLRAVTAAEKEAAAAAGARAAHPAGSARGEAAATQAKELEQEKERKAMMADAMAHSARMESIKAVTVAEKAAAASSAAYASALQGGASQQRAAALAQYASDEAFAQSKAQVEASTRAMQGNIAVTQAEIAALDMTARQRGAYLAGVQAEQQLLQQGVDLRSSEARAYVAAAQAAGEWKGRLQEEQQARQAEQEALEAQQQAYQKSLHKVAEAQREAAAAANRQHEQDEKESQAFLARSDAENAARQAAARSQRELTSAYGSFASSMQSLVGEGKPLSFIAPGPGLANMQAVEGMKARLAALSSRGANDNSAITGPLKSLLGSAAGTRESAAKSLMEEQKDFARWERDVAKQAARDQRDAAKAQKEAAEDMRNAAKDAQQDPYMARNASIYYGAESASFFEEISWGKATANAAEQALEQNRDAAQDAAEDAAQARADRLEQLAEAQAANDIANQQYAELQSIAASTGGLGPMIAALAAAGYAASAEAMQKAVDDAKKQAAIDSLQRQIAQREANMGGSFSSTGGGIPTYGSGLSFAPVVDKPRTSSSYGGAFAEGGYLGAGRWGIAGEAGPEVVRGPAQIDPIRGGGTTVVVNQTNHIHGVSEPERVPEQLRGLVSSATEAAQIRSAMRSAA